MNGWRRDVSVCGECEGRIAGKLDGTEVLSGKREYRRPRHRQESAVHTILGVAERDLVRAWADEAGIEYSKFGPVSRDLWAQYQEAVAGAAPTTVEGAGAKKTSANKTPAKKAAAKKTVARRAVPQRAVAQAPAKKAAAPRGTAKAATAKRTATKAGAAKKAAAKKTPAKKASTGQAVGKRAVPQKAAKRSRRGS